MKLRQIEWVVTTGNTNDKEKKFEIKGYFEGVVEVESQDVFTITNNMSRREEIKNTIYLWQITSSQYGRKLRTFKFKTIKEAKEKAQKICYKMLVKKFFVKEQKISKKVLVEKLK